MIQGSVLAVIVVGVYISHVVIAVVIAGFEKVFQSRLLGILHKVMSIAGEW